METFAEYWTKHKYYVTQRTIASMQTCNANVFCNHTVENQKRQISLRKDSPTSTTLFQCLTIFRIVIWNKKLGWARKKVEESYWPSFCQFDNIVKWNRPKVEEEGIYLLPNSHTWSIFLQTLGVWEWQPAIWNPSHTLSFKGATFVKFAHWSTTTSRRGWVLFTEREGVRLNSNLLLCKYSDCCRGWQSVTGKSWVHCRLPPSRRTRTWPRRLPSCSPRSPGWEPTSSSCDSTTSSRKAFPVCLQPLLQPWRESTNGEFINVRPTWDYSAAKSVVWFSEITAAYTSPLLHSNMSQQSRHNTNMSWQPLWITFPSLFHVLIHQCNESSASSIFTFFKNTIWPQIALGDGCFVDCCWGMWRDI